MLTHLTYYLGAVIESKFRIEDKTTTCIKIFACVVAWCSPENPEEKYMHMPFIHKINSLVHYTVSSLEIEESDMKQPNNLARESIPCST